MIFEYKKPKTVPYAQSALNNDSDYDIHLDYIVYLSEIIQHLSLPDLI